MKKTLLSFVTLLACVTLQAKPVDYSVLLRVAQQVLQRNDVVDVTPSTYTECKLFAGADGRGFALIAADDCVRPVLAYSRDGYFPTENMPAHVSAWIDGYRREIASLCEAGAIPSAQVTAEWSAGGRPAVKSSEDSVEPLLTTRWNQAPIYNDLCPYDQEYENLSVTGCAATAMAQVMKYWNHPVTGWGSYSYIQPGMGTLSANFGATTYQWNHMPNYLSMLSDSIEKAAVAELMYHCGVSIQMNYSAASSGAYVITDASYPSVENAFLKYFKYSPMLRGLFKQSYSDSEWDDLLRFEIYNGRPVLYAGYDTAGGHAFVLDGYSPDGMFHVNWGWGGWCDGYYTTDSLSPGASGIGGNATHSYNLGNHALFGVSPLVQTSDSVAIVNMAIDTNVGYIDGNGNYSINVDTAEVVARALDGYRFVRWFYNGSTKNPITFMAHGDLADSAIYAPIVGDTIGFCDKNMSSAWHDDYGNTTEWGIRIPASVRQPMRRLTAVQLYVYQQDLYTMRIFIGDSIESAEMVYEENIMRDFSGMLNQWHTFELASPIAIPEGSTVWVTFSCMGGGHPATQSFYSGNSNGSWYKLPQGWAPYDRHGLYATWMIQAIMEERPYYVDIKNVGLCDESSFSGEGYYNEGEVVTVSVGDQHFLYWDGISVADSAITFTVTGDTTFYAYCRNTGIVDVDADGVRIVVEYRTVTVEVADDVEVAFYDMQGRCLATGRRFVAPARGVYMAQIGGKSHKLIIM